MTAVYSHSLMLLEGLVTGENAYDNIDEALRIAAGLSTDRAGQLMQLARGAFERAYLAVLGTAAMLLILSLAVLKRVMHQPIIR